MLILPKLFYKFNIIELHNPNKILKDLFMELDKLIKTLHQNKKC